MWYGNQRLPHRTCLYNNTPSEKFANENEQIAIKRLNGGTNESFKQPTRRTKTFIHKIIELQKRRRDNKYRLRLNRRNGQTTEDATGRSEKTIEKNSKILTRQGELRIEKATRDSDTVIRDYHIIHTKK